MVAVREDCKREGIAYVVGKDRFGKLAFGALGIGGLKLKLHRACVGKLFDSSEAVFDAEEIYALAKEMA